MNGLNLKKLIEVQDFQFHITTSKEKLVLKFEMGLFDGEIDSEFHFCGVCHEMYRQISLLIKWLK